MKALIWLWTVVCMHFAAQLYFSENRNLDNPEVNLMIPALKDGFWIVCLMAVLHWKIRRRGLRLHNPIMIVVIGNLLFMAVYATALYALYHSIEWYYVRYFKNLLFYGTLSYVFVNCVADGGLLRPLLRYTNTLATVSLVVGILFHFLSPIQSESGRMFGVYGNPNAVGFVAVGNIALTFTFAEDKSFRYQMLSVVLSVTAVVLSASMSALGMLIAFVPIYTLFRRYFRCPILLVKTLLTFVAGAGLAVTVYLGLTFRGQSLLHDRVSQIVSTGESDSIDERIYRWNEVLHPPSMQSLFFGRLPFDHRRTDSSLVDVLYHFGFVGLAFFLLPLLIVMQVIMRYETSTRTMHERMTMSSLCAGVATLSLCNLPMQFQFEVFPTNYFVILLIVSTMLLGVKRAASPKPDVVVRPRPLWRSEYQIPDIKAPA